MNDRDTGWVCEAHPNSPLDPLRAESKEACDGAGMPCACDIGQGACVDARCSVSERLVSEQSSHKAASTNDFDEFVREVETRYELPGGFLQSIVDTAPDWSLVVQMHALVESATLDFLLEHINTPSARRHLATIPFRAKFKWASTVDDRVKRHKPFADQLSDVRNRYAHNIKNIAHLSLVDVVAELDPGERRSFLSDKGAEVFAANDADVIRRGIARYTLFFNSAWILFSLRLAETALEKRRQAEREAQKLLESLLNQQALQRLLEEHSQPPADQRHHDNAEASMYWLRHYRGPDQSRWIAEVHRDGRHFIADARREDQVIADANHVSAGHDSLDAAQNAIDLRLRQLSVMPDGGWMQRVK